MPKYFKFTFFVSKVPVAATFITHVKCMQRGMQLYENYYVNYRINRDSRKSLLKTGEMIHLFLLII